MKKILLILLITSSFVVDAKNFKKNFKIQVGGLELPPGIFNICIGFEARMERCSIYLMAGNKLISPNKIYIPDSDTYYGKLCGQVRSNGKAQKFYVAIEDCPTSKRFEYRNFSIKFLSSKKQYKE
jgi:hypothetical protein